MNGLDIPPGLDFLEAGRVNGHRPPTGGAGQAVSESPPGTALISWAAWLLTLIGAAALYVSFDAQRQYVFGARHQDAASIIEALLLDLLMITFTLLALGLSRAGKSSRTERTLILLCAVASAYMNVSAADTASPRSIVAYAVAPVALAVVVDRVVAVLRRHVQADHEASAWTAAGQSLAAAARLTGTIALYVLRFALAPPSTATGIRRWILAAAPLPEPARRVPSPENPPRHLAASGLQAGVPRWAPMPGAHPPAGGELTAPGGSADRVQPSHEVDLRPGSGDDLPTLTGPDGGQLAQLRPAGHAAGDGTPSPGPRAAATVPAAANREPGAPVTFEAVRAHYAADLAAGEPVSGKAIRRQFKVGSTRAGQFAERLAAETTAAAARSGRSQ